MKCIHGRDTPDKDELDLTETSHTKPHKPNFLPYKETDPKRESRKFSNGTH